MHIDLTRATGEAMPAAQPDPLFTLILDLDIESDRYEDLRDAPPAYFKKLKILMDRLENHTPQCTTRNGAAGALSYLADELRSGNLGHFHEAVLSSVLIALVRHRDRWLVE